MPDLLLLARIASRVGDRRARGNVVKLLPLTRSYGTSAVESGTDSDRCSPKWRRTWALTVRRFDRPGCATAPAASTDEADERSMHSAPNVTLSLDAPSEWRVRAGRNAR